MGDEIGSGQGAPGLNLKQRVLDAIERRGEEIIAVGDDICGGGSGDREVLPAQPHQRHLPQDVGAVFQRVAGETGM